MAASYATHSSNDHQGNVGDFITFNAFKATTLGGSVEFVFGLPASGVDGQTTGNGWELVAAEVGALVNTTHDTSESITATVEKTDGGTSMLATAPVITAQSSASAGAVANSANGGTEAVRGVASATQANKRLSDFGGFIVTLTEAGSGGTGASDVYAVVTFQRLQDYNPAA